MSRPSRLPCSTVMPPTLEDVVDLALREVVRALVGGDAVLVEAAGLVAGLEHDDLMAERGELDGRRRGRPARRRPRRRASRSARPWRRAACPRANSVVGGVALQTADLDRLALGGLADAGLLAQRLGRADAGAHAADDVGVEDRLGRADGVAGDDLADEQRDVDRGRAGLHAGRVVAEQAALGGDPRLVLGREAGAGRRSSRHTGPGTNGRTRCQVSPSWECLCMDGF